MNVIVAVIDASNSRLLAAREAALQPGASVCIATPGPPQTAPVGPDQRTNGPGLVIGIVVRNGIIKQGRAQGSILIDDVGPGGGCIVASLQLQSPAAASLLGPTRVYITMAELKTVLQNSDD